jgi:hypothetical protein
MKLERQLLDIERRLWTNDAAFYHENLVEDALLVFPETGIITRAMAVEAIRAENAEGRRWAEVDLDDVSSLRFADTACLLTYRATARWEHETARIVALASSVYTLHNGTWKLAFHQQTPLQS